MVVEEIIGTNNQIVVRIINTTTSANYFFDTATAMSITIVVAFDKIVVVFVVVFNKNHFFLQTQCRRVDYLPVESAVHAPDEEIQFWDLLFGLVGVDFFDDKLAEILRIASTSGRRRRHFCLCFLFMPGGEMFMDTIIRILLDYVNL